MKNYTLSILAGLLLMQVIAIEPMEAKNITITERQEILMKKIDQGEKSGELTLKEAEALRNEGNKITEKQAKMKDKNGGKLSYADITKIEKELNKLSLKIQKKGLEKRVD
jgi:predicted ribosome quality control (RQC) complex YloA/Tae2 family protein